MASLSLDDFAPSVGERYEMEVDGTAYPVELIDASPLNDSGREGGSFRLEFRGPADPAFQQGTFTFRRDGAGHDIFVVAVGRDGTGTRYEAVFF
ncbi:MAG: hypothetical protein QOI38_3186 [Sphingomonadales bacterium]|jgi:hypothetical protein|nr:hypothetical protein [Sphingomonadales bacterium]